MTKKNVIAIYDIGKTNKKVFLFNENYEIVYEQSSPFEEITDEDGDPCDDLQKLTQWIKESFVKLQQLDEFDVKAINFTTYGASFVYVDEDGKPLTPLYNYLKEYPAALKEKFYSTYGGELVVSRHTASPVLGSLNSGLQVYRLKYEQPEVYSKAAHALHLPQYASYLLTGKPVSDLTSIGCHTKLWNFPQQNYHEWVLREGIADKLAPLFPSDQTVDINGVNGVIKCGTGLHDSSAALIPYLANFIEPFILISTGTWSISLNPFNSTPLTEEELKQDCLCYLTFKGAPVKASRLFAGYEHEQEVKRLAAHFSVPEKYYSTVEYNPETIADLRKRNGSGVKVKGAITRFSSRDLAEYTHYEEAYHQLVIDIVEEQIISTNLILGTTVKRIFVDGGFSKNPVYMNLLAEAFEDTEVYAASVAQATALGAALAIHHQWNKKPVPANCINLLFYNGHK